MTAAPLFMALGRFGLSFGKYPALQKYYDMVKERPSVVSSFAPGWREEPDKDWLGDI
jgi:glutathione S-transferase